MDAVLLMHLTLAAIFRCSADGTSEPHAHSDCLLLVDRTSQLEEGFAHTVTQHMTQREMPELFEPIYLACVSPLEVSVRCDTEASNYIDS
jgi:hypothetical protein